MTMAIASLGGRLPVTAGRRQLLLIVIWGALILVPFWLPLLGGYTALAGRVLVFGLAAMGLNMLLGFTGVLSFGHAAYFGLGAYGAGLTLRYLVHSTPLAMLAGRAEPFDVVFLDPPFGGDLWEASAEPLESRGWPAAHAWIYVEAPADAVLALPATWMLHREGHAGAVRFALYRRAAADPVK